MTIPSMTESDCTVHVPIPPAVHHVKRLMGVFLSLENYAEELNQEPEGPIEEVVFVFPLRLDNHPVIVLNT